jgi:hypothetical protein
VNQPSSQETQWHREDHLNYCVDDLYLELGLCPLLRKPETGKKNQGEAGDSAKLGYGFYSQSNS